MTRTTAAKTMIFALLLALGGGSLFIVTHRHQRQTLTCVIGDAAARAAAVVPASLANRYFDAARIQFGVGTAAIGGWTSLGDAVVVGGQAWLRTTYGASPNYYALVNNRYFQSNYLAYVPLGVRPIKRINVQAGTSAGRLLQELARLYPGGVMVAGYVQMQTLRTIAIAEPAFNGLPIATHTPFYYTEPMETARNTWVYLVGITARLTLARWSMDGAALRRLVPQAQMQDVDGLVDVLRLHEMPTNTQAPPTVQQAATIGQLVGSATLARGELSLYPVQRIARCADAYVH